jgi:universal stress protein family protein
MRHLLLPFTHGIDGSAITYALSLAQHRQATLVLLSLQRPHGRSGKQAVRWEDIQQAADLLVFTQQKAARMGVSLQHVELRTPHPVQSIRAFAREMDCEGILLFVRRGEGVLLSTHEVKQLLEDLQDPLYVANLPVSNPWLSLFGWFRKRGASHP